MTARQLRIAVLLIAACASFQTAQGFETKAARRWRYRAAEAANIYTWHGDYYHTAWGRPVAVVVPPTAALQTDYHWGVGGTRVTPIYHQFSRGYPGVVESSGAPFRGTPRWPSDTDQFGVYYVRGPW